jgi:glycosyltransferase involved in cell wall biosynthesis
MVSKVKISLVVPVYRKAGVVKKFFSALNNLLLSHNLAFEIIAVIDGSPDNSAELIAKLKLKSLKVVNLPTNTGKAFAVREGMSLATGDYIGFLDCGLDIGLTVVERAIACLEQDHDAIIANKFLRSSVRKFSLFRLLISRSFTVLRSILFELPQIDTQTGFKLFRQDIVVDLLPRLHEKRWLIDIEILALMRQLGFTNIHEIPVEINTYNLEETSDSILPKALAANVVDLVRLSSRVGRIATIRKRLHP